MNSVSGRFVVAALFPMALGLASAVHPQDNPPANASATLFQNVRIFDGKGTSLSAPSNVLVKGNVIERISTEPVAADPSVTVIAGNGRTLMPGLIDAHWHAMLIRPDPVQAITGDAGYNNIAAGVEATDTLMRGFTTARDVGGPVFGLKSAIDSGVIAGPRIYPSGALVTVTSGHGDFRQLSELSRTIGGTLSRWLSLQPLPEELREGFPVGSVQRAKADEVWPGIARTYELAKKYKIKTAWGTDVLFS
jgi:imidazolonepropionase-like amidohydrolase